MASPKANKPNLNRKVGRASENGEMKGLNGEILKRWDVDLLSIKRWSRTPLLELNFGAIYILAAARKRGETDTDTVRWEGHAQIWVETHEETRKAGQRGTRESRGFRRKVAI